MWFLAVVLAGAPPADARDVSYSMAAAQSYNSQAACFAASKRRTHGLAMIGMHGGFQCMYHGEPDRELAAGLRGTF